MGLFQLKHSTVIDPDTYYTQDLSAKAGMEAFQAAATVHPGSRFDRDLWVYGQAPASDKVRKVWWHPKEVITSLVYGSSPEAWIVFFFLTYTVQALLCLVKHNAYLLTPWTSHSAKFIVGKVECPQKGFCTPFFFNIYIYHLYIMSEGSSFIQQHSAFVYNKRISLLWYPGDKDKLQAY